MKLNLRETLRGEVRTILKNLDERWLRAASGKVCENLSKLFKEEFADCKSILAWTSFFKGEPDLSDFIAKQIISRNVYLPRSLPDYTLDFILVNINWQASLQSGVHGIPEPELMGGERYSYNESERNVILVPGLAFDGMGNRLGRGKGYYDRFLAKPESKKLVKVGVGLSLQIFEQINTKPHDIPVNLICTEEGIIEV